MIELIVLWCFGRAIGDQAKSMGRGRWKWFCLLVSVWFLSEFVAALTAEIVLTVATDSKPNRLVVYLIGLGCAVAASFILSKILDSLPSLVTQPLIPVRQATFVPLKPLVPASPAIAYYILHDGQQTGPYDVNQLRALIRAGSFSLESHYWFVGAADWQPLQKLSKVLGL